MKGSCKLADRSSRFMRLIGCQIDKISKNIYNSGSFSYSYEISKELAVFDIVTFRRSKSIVNSNDCIIMAIDSNLMIIFDQSYSLLHIYKITQKINRFDMILKLKERIDIGSKNSQNLIGNCFIKDPESIFIAVYSFENDRFEVGKIKLDDFKYNRLIVNLNKLEISRIDMNCEFTAANNFLVVWDLTKNKAIYYFNIFTNQLLLKIEEFDTIDCFYNIFKTNDFILKSQSEIFSIHFNTYTNEIRKVRIKEIIDNFSIGINDEFVWIKLVNTFEVYRLQKFLKGLRPDLIISNSIVKLFCFSASLEYLIVFTNNFELRVYRMNLKGVTKIACLFLNHDLENIIASETFISAKYDKKLLTFEILFKD